MKTIHLNYFGIDVQVPNSFHYHDDGSVADVEEHTSNLFEEYSTTFISEKRSGKITYARCVSFYKGWSSVQKALENNGKVDTHTYILNSLNQFDTTMGGAHEDTHILLKLEKLEVLKKTLRKRIIKARGFRRRTKIEGLEKLGGETIAEIGGLCTLLTNFPEKKFRVSVKEGTIEAIKWLEKQGIYRVKPLP